MMPLVSALLLAAVLGVPQGSVQRYGVRSPTLGAITARMPRGTAMTTSLPDDSDSR
jgi:hypothetical protein